VPGLLLLLLAWPAPQAAPDAGERAFQRCAACHTLRDDDGRSPGPSLRGVVGRRAASVESFTYSDAMREAGRRGVVWDEATLARFLADPESVAPGTTMPYQGGSAAERATLIAWLSRRR